MHSLEMIKWMNKAENIEKYRKSLGKRKINKYNEPLLLKRNGIKK